MRHNHQVARPDIRKHGVHQDQEQLCCSTLVESGIRVGQAVAKRGDSPRQCVARIVGLDDMDGIRAYVPDDLIPVVSPFCLESASTFSCKSFIWSLSFF